MPDNINDLASQFPPDFAWGVATSAFQIEGAAFEDGKGESIWDRFCRQPGAIADGSNGDVACDHYHRLDADLDLIAGLGVDLYRFSISWPRVQPAGEGAWNEKGLAFYDRLVDGLLRRGLAPHLTLNHWDLPQALQDKGGWAARDTVHRFVDYALGIQRRLGDRAAAITTHNEPWVVAWLGHAEGTFAPGVKSRKVAHQVAHHLLLSHGLALRALRAEGARARLGIVLNMAHTMPLTGSPEDAAQARLDDARGRRWYADPLFKGTYPAQVWDELGDDAPAVQPGDMAAIATPLDFLGINYYSRHLASAQGPVGPEHKPCPKTDMGWEIYPDGLRELLLTMHRDYALPPTYITENGGAFPDAPVDGRVHDADRTDYLATHIRAVGQALAQGVPMAGYMVWSLMDNFEWASGYAKRFGIVHVDYGTLARTPKDSALWFRDLVARCRALRGTGA
ncbi:MAG TPA: GH1 family beta-glucosidase [Burkholderiaceae bacterium]|nr:GH1 family beta-glucosidase [Burkholderiaceae bacterium]